MLRELFHTEPERPGQSFEARWHGLVKRRIAVTFAVFAVWAAGVEARLVYLQVYAHQSYEDRAVHQQQNTVRLAASRGDILDRAGNVLAYSVDGRSIIANPKEIKDPAATVGELCAALRDCTRAEQQGLVDRLANGRSTTVRHARFVSPDQADRVALMDLSGVQLLPEPVRYYPKLELASHLVGWVNVDNLGQGGIEYAFDNDIRGRAGTVLVQLDAHRNWMQTTIGRPSAPGATVELSIDLNLQHITERELAAGVEQNRARAGTAIVMDPATGEILALANYPTFNPNTFNKYAEDVRQNRAVQDAYEPGSTFKIVTASAALEGGVIKPDEIIDTDPGFIALPGRKTPITEASGHSYGPLSFEDVIVLSSNVGAVKAGLRIGADRMLHYVHQFGFGEVSGGDFRGQSAGKVWNRSAIDDSALGSMAMGYQVSVTPLQMVTAINAVANGGSLLEPHVVRAIVRNGQREAIAPREVRRAISPETAATLTTFMEGVVERGTATAAGLERYQVAGKTGTAHKAIEGGYAENDYNASFVGFVPSRRPAYTILVVIDTPRAGKYHGGDVAAPIFKRIAEAALAQQGVPPTIRPLPPVIVTANADPASASPRPARAMQPPVVTPIGGRTQMPDVRGLSAREALRVLGAIGLTTEFSGDGFVVTQSPAPGATIEPGGRSALQCRRAPVDARGGGGGSR